MDTPSQIFVSDSNTALLTSHAYRIGDRRGCLPALSTKSCWKDDVTNFKKQDGLISSRVRRAERIEKTNVTTLC
jgi:hypothetical protein